MNLPFRPAGEEHLSPVPRSVAVSPSEGLGERLPEAPTLALATVTSGRRGFTLIEVIGALAILAILATILTTSVVKQADQAAWTREQADLNAIAEAYKQSVLRNKVIPSQSTWVAAVAAEMSLPSASIANNSRRWARAFLIDPSLSIGGAALPYTQTTNGTVKPVSARVMFVSSLSGALPIASGVPSSTDFNAAWGAVDGAKPAGGSWDAWTGTGDDLRIKKLNLEPWFYQLILANRSTAGTAKFNLNGSANLDVPANGVGWDRYYLDGSIIGLSGTSNSVTTLQTVATLDRSISYIFASGQWRGLLPLTSPNSSEGDAFAAAASEYLDTAWNTGALKGATQLTVLAAMYAFMFEYTLWANECPRFDRHGATPAQVPEYLLLDDIGSMGANGRLNGFSGTTGLLK